MKVYLDYAATTPVKPEVLTEILPVIRNSFGNPSSIHSWGQEARAIVDDARKIIADFLGAEPREIIFTSGGTEADNLALKGLLRPLFEKQKPAHLITTQIEHHAVLNTAKLLEKLGVEVTYLKPNRNGVVEVEMVKNAIKDNTRLVSVMYVNNEIGTVQPIREIGKMLEKENETREKNSLAKIYFHTDAVQATGYQEVNADYLHADLISLSAHKIGALKGVGALYVKEGTPIVPILHGGEQEWQRRAGTENVVGIAAFAKAISLVDANDGEKVAKLRDYFIERILKEIPEAELNGSEELRNPNNANFYFRYIEGESILLNLDLVGIGASSGSACTSQSLQPSHVLMAVYNDAERAHGSIRFTFGKTNTQEEVDYVVDRLKEIVNRLRQISPLTPDTLKMKGKNV